MNSSKRTKEQEEATKHFRSIWDEHHDPESIQLKALRIRREELLKYKKEDYAL